jgi:hypothetical protein
MSRHPLYNQPPEKPKPPSTEYRNVYYPPERGGCLSLWLIVNAAIIGIGVFTFCGLFFRTYSRDIRFDRLPANLQTYVIVGLALMVGWGICLIAIWYWKKWGVYGFVLLSFLSLGLEIVVSPQTLDTTDFLSPIISNALLLYVVTNRWTDFK